MPCKLLSELIENSFGFAFSYTYWYSYYWLYGTDYKHFEFS